VKKQTYIVFEIAAQRAPVTGEKPFTSPWPSVIEQDSSELMEVLVDLCLCT